MSSGIWSAASGAVGHLASLDVTGNNLANASTPGFQGDRAVFRQVLADAQRAGNAAEYRRYAVVGTRAPDAAPGAIHTTGRSLDAAIEGEGYFVVQSAQGDRYTRAGSFQVQDAQLVTMGGLPVLDEAGGPISIPEQDAALRISSDGSVYAGEEVIGRLAVVRFASTESLEREGATLFRALQAPTAVPAQLMTESLEMSNVSAVKGMTELVTATRSFEALQRAIETFSEIERRTAMGIMGSRS